MRAAASGVNLSPTGAFGQQRARLARPSAETWMSAQPGNSPSPRQRLAILRRRRDEKMARSVHAYVRGSTVQFYDWLRETHRRRLPEGPSVWICGDCHVGNLGPIADCGGAIDIQIRDLDQTVIGNPAHDLIRLGLSLAAVARGADLPGVTTAHMLEEMIRGYEEALADDRGAPEPDAVKIVRKQAVGRKWRHLVKERLADLKPSIPLGSHFWALSDEERQAVETLFQAPAARKLVTSLSSRDDDAPVELLDAAYWIKGCSSLGLLRVAVLLGVGDLDPRNGGFCLIDIKEAGEAAAPAAPDRRMPRDDARRVVQGARRLSPNLGDRMVAARLLGRPAVLRELLPQDLKIEIGQFGRAEAMRSARYLASVVGAAHARQMSRSDRRAWGLELGRHHAANLDAPSWLWSSVVELAARHEAGYLEHCRRYALAA
ncbi:MAG: hypothetical protein JWO72_1987 [Caulobacteraceae bacterium]|nr:hypothetical protein [Caulobacteraceae bacterium]